MSGVNNTTSVTGAYVYHLSSVSHVVNAVISILTIATNGLVILCLQWRRGKFSVFLWYQIMTLSMSDGFVGVLESLPVLFKIEAINTSTSACGCIMLAFHTSQLATIFNLFHLSVKRVCVMRSHSTSWQRRLPPSLSVCLGVASWILSGVFIIPLAAYLPDNPIMDGCISPALFGSPQQAMKVWTYHTILITMVVLLLNVFYMIAICIVRRPSMLVSPSGGDSSQNNSTTDETGNRYTFFKAQRQAFRHLCIILATYNTTMWPYVIVTTLYATGVIPINMDFPIIDVHLLTLNSLVGAIANLIFVGELRKIFVNRIAAQQ